jgi:ABC-type spermidine/putrescine transport system permease subunit II
VHGKIERIKKAERGMIFTSALFFYAVVSLLINIGGITLCTGSIGCGPVKYFFTMVLPMSKTVVATVSVFTFLNVWNDYSGRRLYLHQATC